MKKGIWDGRVALMAGLPLLALVANAQVLAYRASVTALDGLQCPYPPSANIWAVNPGGYANGAAKARLLPLITIRGTTALADNPILTFRPYLRSGGSTGECGQGTSVAFTRPRTSDAAASVKVQKTINVGAAYTDYSAAVNDNSATTQADVDSLDTVANGDWLVVGSPVPFIGFAADMDATNVNAIATTMTVEYWNGAAWAAVSSMVDGTKPASAILAADGQVTWDLPASDWVSSTINGITMFWVRVSTNAAVSVNVDIEELDILLPIRAAIDIQADGDDVALLLESVSGGTGTLAYSGSVKVVWK